MTEQVTTAKTPEIDIAGTDSLEKPFLDAVQRVADNQRMTLISSGGEVFAAIVPWGLALALEAGAAELIRKQVEGELGPDAVMARSWDGHDVTLTYDGRSLSMPPGAHINYGPAWPEPEIELADGTRMPLADWVAGQERDYLPEPQQIHAPDAAVTEVITVSPLGDD